MQGCSRFSWRWEQANQHVPLSAAPGQECGLAPSGRSTQSQSQHLAVLDSEITMKSVNHSRPSLRTVHLLPSRPSYPEARGFLRHVCTHTPIERIVWNPDCSWFWVTPRHLWAMWVWTNTSISLRFLFLFYKIKIVLLPLQTQFGSLIN